MTGQQSEPWHSPGKYNVSPYNYSEEVRSEYAFPDTSWSPTSCRS